MDIIKTLKNIMKEIKKVVLILLVLIGIGVAGYTSWLLIEAEKKLTFFTEDGRKEFSGIEWSPTNSLWESIMRADFSGYGEKQEGYNSKGRLVFRHVQLDEEIPVVGYYFALMTQVYQLSIDWITDCEPEKTVKEFDMEGVPHNLYCLSNGKLLNTTRIVGRSGKLSQQLQWVEIAGFSFWHERYGFDWDKLERNVALKGGFFD